MSKWYAATVTETVTYRVLVQADNEDDARDQAVRDHEDGLSAEVDSSLAEVESIEDLS